MSNISYWEKRKAQEMFRYMEQAERTSDEIARIYLKASRHLSLRMDEIFERFRKKHGLSEKDAYRLLNTLHDKTSLDELKTALAAGEGNQAELLAELESPAYQARLERLQQLQNQIDLTMKEVYRLEKVKNTSHYVDLANEAYYRSIFNIQQRTGLGFSFSAVDAKMVEQVLNSRWSGANYSKRIWHNTDALAKALKEELLINLMTGRTDREAANIIANKFAQGASNARRLVRTESCYIVAQMDMMGYEECGIETYIFVATLDLRTSETCRKMDEKRFLVSEQQPGKNCPPMHPWCRSTTICDISDEELAQMKRRARDPATGKTKMVPANMTYGKWKVEYTDAAPAKDKLRIKLPDDTMKILGITEDDRIKMEKAITMMQKKYDIWIGEIAVESFGKEERGTYFITGPYLENGKLKMGLAINSDIDYTKIESTIKRKSESGFFAAKNLEDCLKHELAHIMTFQNCSTYKEYKDLYAEINKTFIPGISGYADKCHNGVEMLAEAFVRVQNGEQVPLKVKILLRKYIERWRK